jgi:hypothetical protein
MGPPSADEGACIKAARCARPAVPAASAACRVQQAPSGLQLCFQGSILGSQLHRFYCPLLLAAMFDSVRAMCEVLPVTKLRCTGVFHDPRILFIPLHAAKSESLALGVSLLLCSCSSLCSVCCSMNEFGETMRLVLNSLQEQQRRSPH